MTGTETVPLFVGAPFTVLGEGEPVEYDMVVPYGFPGRMNTTLSGCPESGEDGPSTSSLGIAAVQSGDPVHNGPSDLVKTSADGRTFEGSATATGTAPGESYSWNWSFTGTE